MFLLDSNETSVISDAVLYYDCAGLPSAIEKMQKIENQDVIVMTRDELRQIVNYVKDYDNALHYGAFAPPVLPCWSQLCDMVE